MRGIILAGGTGSRLFPLSVSTSKQLLPIFDKPAFYYSLSTLMLAEITEILIVSRPCDIPHFERHFGDGSSIGISIQYLAQENPNGIAEVFRLARSFINQDICLILGDNLFFANELKSLLLSARKKFKKGAYCFCYRVNNPRDYGVLQLDELNSPISIEEKPAIPKSNLAVTGLYLYSPDVVQVSDGIEPSDRGELEISDVNRHYLEIDQLDYEIFGRGVAWFDVGTPRSQLAASQFVDIIQNRQGTCLGSPEEIALSQNYISKNDFQKLLLEYPKSGYRNYLETLL